MSNEIKDIPAEEIERMQEDARIAASKKGIIVTREDFYMAGSKAEYLRHLSPSSKPEIGPRWVKASNQKPADGLDGQILHIKPVKIFWTNAYQIYVALIYMGKHDGGLAWHWYEGPDSGWHTRIALKDWDKIEYLDESIPSSEPAKDYMQFDKYIIETRNEFVRKFWDMYPNSEKRVVAEDLLICFDQMRERLYQYSQPASQPEPAKESQPVYGIRWESEKSPEKPGKYYCGVKVDGDFEKHIIDWDGNSWGCIEDYDRYDDLEIIEWLHEKAVIAPAPQPEPSESLTAVDYEEVLADHRRLVRELDQIINGNDAATQGSLVDIVAQIRDLWFPSPPSEVNSDDLPHDVGEWATDFIGMEELWKEFSVETTEEDIPGSLVLFKYQFSIVMEKVMTAVRADRKRHADLTAKSSPPSVKPDEVHCCNNCTYLHVDNSADQTGPGIWCSKGRFDVIGSKEEAAMLSQPIDCKDFQPSRPAVQTELSEEDSISSK